MTGTTFLTGASSGIGRSLARRLAAGGEPVAVVARRGDLLASLAADIEAAGGRALAIPCDVTDRVGVLGAVRRAEAELPPIARLVANAGGGEATAVDRFSAQHVAAVVDLNLIGVANCIEAVLPGMWARRSGHIVATSSLAAGIGLPGGAAYSAAKAGVTKLLEGLRIDLRSRGIDVTILSPGFVSSKPGAAAKRNRPLRMDLETCSARMHRAIVERRSHDAFPATLVALIWLLRLLPDRWSDQLLAGRGPTPQPDP